MLNRQAVSANNETTQPVLIPQSFRGDWRSDCGSSLSKVYLWFRSQRSGDIGLSEVSNTLDLGLFLKERVGVWPKGH